MTTTPRKPLASALLADQLRAHVRSTGQTCYALGKASDVDPGSIARFLDGERDLSLANAGRLAEALGLVLLPRLKRERGRPRKAAKPAELN